MLDIEPHDDQFGEMASRWSCRQEKMEMTSPVINTINTDGNQQPQMQFPMEAKYGQSLESLPNPSDGRSELIHFNHAVAL